MQLIRKTIASLTTTLVVSALVLNFNACSEQSPLQHNAGETGIDKTTLGKKSKNTLVSYPQSGSVTVQYYEGWNEYGGADITLPNGSTFYFDGASLTPPPDTPFGEAVTITFTAEKNPDNSEMVFSFGPSGCQFSPAAQVKLSWKDLDIEVPTLYYIANDGEYIEQQPDDISTKGKWMLVNIHHFSRYAMAWSN